MLVIPLCDRTNCINLSIDCDIHACVVEFFGKRFPVSFDSSKILVSLRRKFGYSGVEKFSLDSLVYEVAERLSLIVGSNGFTQEHYNESTWLTEINGVEAPPITSITDYTMLRGYFLLGEKGYACFLSNHRRKGAGSFEFSVADVADIDHGWTGTQRYLRINQKYLLSPKDPNEVSVDGDEHTLKKRPPFYFFNKLYIEDPTVDYRTVGHVDMSLAEQLTFLNELMVAEFDQEKTEKSFQRGADFLSTGSNHLREVFWNKDRTSERMHKDLLSLKGPHSP